MLTLRVGHDTDYLTDAVAKGREGYYTDAVAAGEPPGLWYGRGAEALGLVGEVDPVVMKALYTHGLDPRDPNTADRETWHKAARFGNPPRNYRSAEQIYAGLLERAPATPGRRSAPSCARRRRSRRGSRWRSTTWCCRRRSRTRCCGWRASAPPATPPPPATRRPRPSGSAGRRGLGGGADGRRTGRCWTSWPRRPGTPAPGITAAAAGSGWTRHDWTVGPVPAARLPRPRPAAARPRPARQQGRCAPDGKVRALDFSLFTPVARRRRRLRRPVRRGRTCGSGSARGGSCAADGQGPADRRGRRRGVEAVLQAHRRDHARPGDAGRPVPGRDRARAHQPGARRPGRAGDARPRGAAKVFGGETRDGQLARWAAEYDAAFGARRRHPRHARRSAGRPPTAERLSERDVVTRALAAMEDTRQSWTRSNLMMAVADALPGHLGIAPSTDRAAAGRAHRQGRGAGPAPEPAHRPAGPGREVLPGRRRERVRQAALAALRHPEPAARRGRAARGRGPPRRPGLDRSRTPTEIVARFARAGRDLAADQAAALRGILTSGAAVEVLNAPAGTGKSFLVGTLADTWPLTGRPSRRPGAAGAADRAGTGRGCSASPTGNGRPTCSPRKA